MSGLFDYTDFPDEPAEYRSPEDELTHIRPEADKYREIKALLDPFDVGRVPIVEIVKALMVEDAITKAKATAWDKLQAEIAAGTVIVPRLDDGTLVTFSRLCRMYPGESVIDLWKEAVKDGGK